MNRNRALWIAQGLLAVFFLFVGFMKLTAPAEVLATQFPLPAEFIRFIGVCEMLGALGNLRAAVPPLLCRDFHRRRTILINTARPTSDRLDLDKQLSNCLSRSI